MKEHGATAKGVDWSSEESQQLRFQQLIKLLPDADQHFTLLDYGCGYGALKNELVKTGRTQAQYHGYDISEEMIKLARERSSSGSVFYSLLSEEKFDFVLSSGLFNVRLQHDDTEWKEYVLRTIKEFWSRSKRGIAFNVLSSYSDREHMRSDLFYANPLEIFDFCKRTLSKRVALLHDYPLYEFTMIVRRD